jgi:uncharacterized phage protein (TIGR02220 family)
MDSLSIVYRESIDTQSQKEEEKEEEKEKYNNLLECVIKHLNTVTGVSYKLTTRKTVDCIKARINEGYNDLEQYKYVIDLKASQWLNTEQQKYLRPETLFGPKFESYLNERPIAKIKKSNELKGATCSPNPTVRVPEW